MAVDPIEGLVDVFEDEGPNDEHDDVDYVDMVEATSAWTRTRDEMAELMWQDYAR